MPLPPRAECAGRAAGSISAAGLAPTEQPVPGYGGASVLAVIQKVTAK
jgi:hypothetical protein